MLLLLLFCHCLLLIFFSFVLWYRFFVFATSFWGFWVESVTFVSISLSLCFHLPFSLLFFLFPSSFLLLYSKIRSAMLSILYVIPAVGDILMLIIIFIVFFSLGSGSYSSIKLAILLSLTIPLYAWMHVKEGKSEWKNESQQQRQMVLPRLFYLLLVVCSTHNTSCFSFSFNSILVVLVCCLSGFTRDSSAVHHIQLPWHRDPHHSRKYALFHLLLF